MKERDGLRFAVWLATYCVSVHAARMGITDANKTRQQAKEDACNALDEFDKAFPAQPDNDD